LQLMARPKRTRDIQRKMREWEDTVSKAIELDSWRRQRWRTPNNAEMAECLFFVRRERKWVGAAIAEIYLDEYDMEWLEVWYEERGVKRSRDVMRNSERIMPMLCENSFISIYFKGDRTWRDAVVTKVHNPHEQGLMVEAEFGFDDISDFNVDTREWSIKDLAGLMRTKFTRRYERPRAELNVHRNIAKNNEQHHADRGGRNRAVNQQRTKPAVATQRRIKCKDQSAKVNSPPKANDRRARGSIAFPADRNEVRIHPSRKLYTGEDGVTECPACGGSAQDDGCCLIRLKKHDADMMDNIKEICSIRQYI